MKIYIGSDHTGTNLKNKIIHHYQDKYQFINCSSDDETPLNYAKIGIDVATCVAKDEGSLGIVICGSGIGISIAANKVQGIRCALIYNKEVAALAKQHNNANVIALGAREFSEEMIFQMLDVFFDSHYEGGRHEPRISTITTYEKK